MKKKLYFLPVLILAFGVLPLLSRSGGLAFVGGQVRTNSPAHPFSCGGCHINGGGGGGMTVQLLDANNNIVTSYVANQSYMVAIGITDPNAVVGGFQIECLDGSNIKSGTFSTSITSPGTQITNFGPFQVAEHSTPGTFSSFPPLVANGVGWVVNWTAPAVGGNSLTFYANGVAANGNGGNGGDDGYVTSLSLASLPVTFISQEADVVQGQVRLSWEVVADETGGIFDIERSTDGVFFSPIHTLTATYVTGTTQTYSFSDNTAPMGQQLAYRIRYVSMNGEVQVSETMSANIAPSSTYQTKVFPNPVHVGNRLSVNMYTEQPGPVVFSWFGQDGRLLLEQEQNTTSGSQVLQLKAPDHAGNFVLLVTHPNGTSSHRITIQ